MADFSVTQLRNNNIAYLNRMRDNIELDPVYQRQGAVWSKSKQALLIDSIMNEFDIPKIYLHEHMSPITVKDRTYRYSLIDGRQRLEAIWDFLDGKFALPDEFVLLSTGSKASKGKTFPELQADEDDPEIDDEGLASLFTSSQLDVMCVRTDDPDLIEEMFSRLNEAVPLTAAEKRNGRGGPLRGAVHTLCGSAFFQDKLPFSNTRYRHYDVATKFLRFADANGPASTKKQELDDFWDSYKRDDDTASAEHLVGISMAILSEMEGVFESSDRLLGSVGMVSIYFLLFMEIAEGRGQRPSRTNLTDFEHARRLNRFEEEGELRENQRRLLEFDRLSQSPNDESALQFRLDVLRDYLADPAAF